MDSTIEHKTYLAKPKLSLTVLFFSNFHAIMIYSVFIIFLSVHKTGIQNSTLSTDTYCLRVDILTNILFKNTLTISDKK